ncbi:class II fructose-bisphosphate aldolase [Candidatus Berkelbacteria bacterium]|nr:class II fructose-bisphosphate aldolase [Candidatus Berkelbacteria bacterium]
MASAVQLFNQARHEGWAIGAFNVANLETIQAICQAAARLEAPVLIESSPGETEYIGAKALADLVSAYRERYGVQVFLNLDHAITEEVITEALAVGYDLIHFDGGELEFAENLKRTQQLVRVVHRHKKLIEGEIDHITGSSTLHKESAKTAQDSAHFTDPEQAHEFVRVTNIDTLAVSIGNVHGVYATPPRLDLERLAKIHTQVPCFLSLHGGSGISEADIRAAIKAGITKVNVNSELRIAFLTALQKAVKAPKEMAAYKYLPPVIKAVQAIVEKKITLFGSTGKAKRTWIKRIIA